MRVLICGGRDFRDYAFVKQCLDKVHEKRGPIGCIIEGGQRTYETVRSEEGDMKVPVGGADYLGYRWAIENGIEVETHCADWKRHGPSAGLIRNTKMITHDKPDAVIAFPGGSGTCDMVVKAMKAEIPVWQPAPKKSDSTVHDA